MKNIFTIGALLFTFFLYAQKQTYSIGMLIDHTNPEIEGFITQIKKEIKAVVGEDAVIDFTDQNILVNNYNLNNAANQYKQLKGSVDIIISAGMFNNLMMSRQSEFPIPTIVLSALTKEISGLDTSKNTSGINNLTYLTTSNSFVEDLKRFKELTDFKNIGIVVEAPLMNALDFNTIFSGVLKGMETDFKIIPYNNLSDIKNSLDGIDALHLAVSFTLSPDEIKQLAATLIEKKIPSFSSSRRNDVINGLMATNIDDDSFNQYFRRVALIIEAYINGTNFSEQPVFIELNDELTINYQTAESVDVPLNFDLIGQTNFVGGSPQNPSAQAIYNLPEAINKVLADNLALQISKKGVEVVEQDIKTAKSNYLPNASVSATGAYVDPELAEVSGGQNPEVTTSGAITLEQLLFSESANANIGINKSLAKAQQESFNTDQLDLIFNVSQTYFNVLILKSNLNIQVRNLDLTKRNLKIAEENFEVGEASKTDVLRFRSQMAQNTQSMVEALNALFKSFSSMNQLLNNPINYAIDIEDVSLDEGIFERYNYNQFRDIIDNPRLREHFTDFMVAEALKNAPELKQLSYNMDVTERSLKLYGSGRFLPTLALQGSYNREFSRSGVGSQPIPGFPDGYYNVGVNLSLPIINNNQNNINRQTAFIQKEQLELNKESTEQLIELNMRNAVLDLINQVSNIELSKVAEEAAKESLELTQTSYSSGAVNIVQLIDAQNNYFNAQLTKANAIYNYLTSMLQIERYLGYYFLLHTDAENNDFNRRFLEYLNERN